MKDLPNSFWAAMFILIACLLGVAALYTHDKTDTAAIITMASSIITGAFGYIQGNRDGHASAIASASAPPPIPPTPAPSPATPEVGKDQ